MFPIISICLLLTTTANAVEEPWWSCTPLVQPATPGTNDERHPIDRFLELRIHQLGLKTAGPADPRVLVRRASFDLTGLPPSMDLIQTYADDATPQAWSALVDTLLDSEQYGVKWGRHWLDLVRWAETDSFERDNRKPSAWRYRDWVVDAFNNDMPYDRFILEQLAGDELPDRSLSSMIATGYHRLGIWDDEPTDIPLAQYDDLDGILDTTSRVMLGMSMGCARCHTHKKDPIPHADYYRMLAFFHGITPYKSTPGNSINPRDFVKQIPIHLDEPERDVAREHDWRRQRAELVAAIEGSHAQLAAAPGPPVHRNGLVLSVPEAIIDIEPPVTDDFTVAFRFRTEIDPDNGTPHQWWTGSGLVSGEVPGITADWGISFVAGGRVIAGTGNPERAIASPGGLHDGQWHHVALGRTRASGQFALYIDGDRVAEGTGSTDALDAPDRIHIGHVLPGRQRFEGELENVQFWDRTLPHRMIVDLALGLQPLPSSPASTDHEHLVRNFMSLHRPTPATTEVLCVMEPDTTPPPTHVLGRGNPQAHLELVEPGFPAMLGGGQPENIAPTQDSSGRRLALAKWIIDPGNLRTARVMANRLWQHHFGTGLVPTPNEFGALGLPPTHPELLDWLAVEFINCDWSIKAMHRLIMSSDAYKRSSIPSGNARELDPLDTALSWYPMRRLTAEELRDSILSTNGTINLQLGGPSIYPPMPEEVLATSSRPADVWGHSTPEQSARRSIYIHLKRSLLDPLLTAFDLADTDSTCPVRFVTTQPTQALTLLNSDFIHREALLLATRLQREADTSEQQIRRGIEVALAREATTAEVDSAMELLSQLQSEDGLSPNEALERYCLVLLNLNEFVHLD